MLTVRFDSAPTDLALRRIPHVVVVGAGFGGMRVARGLAGAPVQVTVVDRANHHLFRPLLYQVATAALSPDTVAFPIREALGRRQENARVVMAEVVGGDLERREIVTADGETMSYDYLVLATGGIPTFFGHPEWAEHVFHLGSLADAMRLREQLLTCFERAERTHDLDERIELLTFAVIGGGATGVELAGALAELGRAVMPPDFRRVHPEDVRIVLYEMAPRLLGAFDEELAFEAAGMLEELGVEVHCGSEVTNIDGGGVVLDGGERLACATVCWASGTRPVPIGERLGLIVDDAGAMETGPDLAALGHPEIFCIGDGARFVPAGSEDPLPRLAPVALQQGVHVAQQIRRALARRPRMPFRYRERGMLTTVGRSRAVLQRGDLRLAGTLAWLLWCVVHIWFLVGVHNRLRVVLGWLWHYLRFRPGGRVATDAAGDPAGDPLTDG